MTEEWIFVAGRDSIGGDAFRRERCDLESAPADVVAVNTLGFYKNAITLPLVYSAYFRAPTDGLWIRKNILPPTDGDYETIDWEAFELK